MKITILGAGAMGAALTVPFTDRRYAVALWCTDRDDEVYHALSSGKAHPSLATRLPDQVRVFDCTQIEDAMAGAELLVLAVSTLGILPVIRRAAPLMRADTPILTAAKGFLASSEMIEPIPSALQLEIQRLFQETKPPILCLTGPSIAGELARRRPTAAAFGGEDHRMVRDLCDRLAADYFWLDVVQDLRGLEICLAYKNTYSIALAWADGMDESSGDESNRNLSAIFLMQAVDELRRLIRGRHGNPDTANGWAGVGDLATTADGGRNGHFGRLLGSGKSSDEAAAILAKEGVSTIEGRTAMPHGVEYACQTFGSNWAAHLPLLHSIQQVLEGPETVRGVVQGIERFRQRDASEIPPSTD